MTRHAALPLAVFAAALIIPARAAAPEPAVRRLPPVIRGPNSIPGWPQGAPDTDALPGSDHQVNQDTSTAAQNETSIAVNPANPLNVVGCWNDYFVVNPGQNTV